MVCVVGEAVIRCEELYTATVAPGALALEGVVKLSPDTGFDGMLSTRSSGQNPRVLQLSLRVSW